MSYGVSNETPLNSDAYDTKNATILPKISISLDPPIFSSTRLQNSFYLRSKSYSFKEKHDVTHDVRQDRARDMTQDIRNIGGQRSQTLFGVFQFYAKGIEE